MCKILYISYDGLTDPLGQSQILSYLSKIAINEISIDILSYDKKEVYSRNKLFVENILKNSNIDWHPLRYSKYPPIISTLWDIIKGWQKIKKLNQKNNYQVVHCRGYIPGILGLKLKKKFKTKLIFDMRGWWCDEKIESGNWNNFIFKPIYKYFKKKEQQLFKMSDKTISLTFSGKEEILKNKWTTKKKIGVIPTCVDFENFPEWKQLIREETRKKLNLSNDKFILTYSGSLGGNYDFNDFSIVFHEFLKRSSKNHILILSKTPLNYLESKINEHNLDMDKITIISTSFKDVHKYLQASDIGLILYNRSFSVIGRSPTKLGEYWCSGIPTLSLKNIGDLNTIYSKYPNGGVLINNINSDEIEIAFNQLEKEIDKQLLRSYSKDYFHINKGVKFYSDIYKELSPN